MIVPFAAGGPTDVIARIVTGHMAQTLGQSIIIENVVGAGGTTATTRAARAANDGYTLITGHMGTHAASVPLYPNLAYHPEKDFEPVALLAGTPILILARKDFAPKDLKEFVAYVKANADKVNAAHAGIGSVSHVSCELLNSILDVKPVGVPFNGTGPAMNALVGGQVDYMCDQIVNAVPQINGGTIKAYAIATPERNPSLPNVPTTAEAGLPAFQAQAWNAIFAPKGTPAPIVARLNAAAAKALDDENVRKRLLDLGSVIPGPLERTPEALATLVKDEIAKWIARAQAGELINAIKQIGKGRSTRFRPLSFAERIIIFRGIIGGSRIGAVDCSLRPLNSPSLERPEDLARHEPVPRPARTDSRRRRGEARPHRHRHAVDLRPSDALQSGGRLSDADHQEAAAEVDRARAAVVPDGRHQHQISARTTASRSGTNGPTPMAISARSMARSGAPGRRRTAAASTRSPTSST